MESAKLLEILANYNRFWSGEGIDAGVERDILEPVVRQLSGKEVIVLKGVRRSGKSTLMDQVIRYLLAGGTDPRQILRVNLEEPLLAMEYSIELLEQIYRTYREKINPEGHCWLFLDEIQNISGWERWVRGRGETENIKVFVIGSSARMLSRDIGTKLTGRQISFEIFPLSFPEFLRFNEVVVSTETDYVGRKPLIRKLFEQYLQYGGFPEVVLKKEDEDKSLLLKSYFDDIVYRDIIARHEIRDIANLRNLAVYLLTNTARLTSVNKLKKNFTISQDKTENYVSAILESYLLFQLQKFSFSLKSTMRAGFKPYAIDTGLRNRIAFSFSEDAGWLVENLIFLHLKQSYDEVYFLTGGHETDFAVKEGLNIVRRIQIWYADPHDTKIPEREIAFFRPGRGEKVKDSDCILLTNDIEKNIEIDGVRIECRPVIKFLLGL